MSEEIKTYRITPPGDEFNTDGDTDPLTGDSQDGDGTQQHLENGSYVGRYLILKQLGRGGMGVVYKAYDPKLDRRIALKLLSVRRRDPVAANRARERLLREAQALAQLSHPNVVSAYDVGTIDEDVFVTMELVEGQTLPRWRQKNHPSVRQILAVMIAAGQGIAAAHQAGLIHRDIKSDNIIVGEDGRVRVLDFGLARAATGEDASQSQSGSLSDGQRAGSAEKKPSADETLTGESRLRSHLTLDGAVLGTPGYMAPEQYLSLDLDEFSDQYSYCVTFYEMLYGRLPVRAKKFKQFKNRVTSGKIDPAPADSRVPMRLRKILLRGLSVTKEARFCSSGVTA